MLITFSGIVGSGKSTSAKYVQRLLRDANDTPLYLRFRFLSWKKMLATSSQKKAAPKKKAKSDKREQSLRTNEMRSLSFFRFAGYLGRMLNFRFFKLIVLRNRIGICDRYFYDNLVHYCLKSKREQLYLRILKRAIPTPDAGFMLATDLETILQRRGNYEPTYIYRLSENYERISAEFRNLTVIRTDGEREAESEIARRTSELMNKTII